MSKVVVLLPMAIIAVAALLVEGATAGGPRTIVVGDDPDQPSMNIGWMDGACYLPIENVRVGDFIEFNYQGHNVYKMKDRRSYERCDFRDAVLLGGMDSSPYYYEVMESDLQHQQHQDGISEIYFACKVGSHCQGQQRVRVRVNGTATAITVDGEEEPASSENDVPVSKYALGVSSSACDLVQSGNADPSLLERAMESSCSEPVPLSSLPKDHIQRDEDDDRPWMFTTCLSPPVTLTPGGVINQATVLHFPYPTDRRVLMGSRIWEFVANDDLVPVNVNQLYVHHILGGVVMGNGAESIRRSDEDAAFPPPYGRLSGDFSDIMTFHLIDIREVDQWLECVECRCRDVNGTYLNTGGAGEDETTSVSRRDSDDSSDDDDDEDDLAGGISCCSNCTTLTTPTVDYRLRYNVTYMDIPEEEPVQPIVMLSADIAPATQRSLEFDVPMWEDLPPYQRLPDDPTVQVLERAGKIRNMFRKGFFGAPYDGPDEIEIHRCTGHMHIGALEQWLEDARTGEIICHNKAVYGTDPTADKGFVTSISVKNFEEEGPMVIAADKRVRLITHYNASVVHTGVMGMFFLFVSEYEEVTKDKAALVVDVCSPKSCNASMLPRTEDIPVCEDDLGFFCRFLGVCDCETFLEREEVTGCGGVVMTARGNFSTDRFCARTCGCKHLEREGAKEEVMREGIEKAMISNVTALCHYSSEGCHNYLSNLYACADEKPGSEEMDDFLMSMMVQKGRRMALDYAKLGDRAIHRFDPVLRDEHDVPTCIEEEDSSAAGHGSFFFMLFIGMGVLFFF